MEDPNTCCICFEKLSSAPFGATVPCGHCVHMICWEKWEIAQNRENQIAQNRKTPKCMLCNDYTCGFVQLYLDLNLTTLLLGDDQSVSSTEDIDENDEIDVSAREHTNAQEVIVIDDDAKPLKDYKKMAKTLKGQLEGIKKIQEIQLENLNTVSANLNTVSAKCRHQQQELESANVQQKRFAMERTNLVMEVEEERRIVQQLSKELEASKMLNKKNDDRIQQLLHKVKRQSHHEQIEYLKICKEHKQYQQKVRDLEEQLRNCSSQTRVVTEKDKKRVLRQVSLYEETLQHNKPSSDQHTESKIVQAKASVHAKRLGDQIQKKKKGPKLSNMNHARLLHGGADEVVRPTINLSKRPQTTNPANLLSKKQKKQLTARESMTRLFEQRY